jgi:hypothetical protein
MVINAVARNSQWGEKMTRKGVIYIVGVFGLGLMHWSLKASFSGPVFLGVTVVYLLVLRFIVEKFGGE